MFGYNPASQLIQFSFAKNYLQAPQQLLSRFWHRCGMDPVTGIQDFKPIMPQIDGHDFAPYPDPAANPPGTPGNYAQIAGQTGDSQPRLPFQEVPMDQFNIKQVGVRFRGHTINMAVDKTTAWTLTIDYRTLLASMFAGAIARFRDRVMLHNADSFRIINGSWTQSSISAAVENFSDENRYVIAPTGSSPALGYLDLDTLMDMRLFFDNDELAGMGMPVCVAGPYQIRNLLKDQKMQSYDYNSIKALVRGDVNSFMGFEFIMCKMGQTAKRGTTGKAGIYTKVGAAFTDRADAKGASGSAGYTNEIDEAEKVIFAHPQMAFGCSRITPAGYARVIEDYRRSFAWQFMVQEVISFRRKQDEYVRVAYAKKATKTGVAPRRAPTKLDAYYTNYSSTGVNWSYGSSAQSAA